MRTDPQSEFAANSALASSLDAQARWHAIPDPRHAAPLITAHTTAQAVVVHALIGSLDGVDLEPLNR